MKTAKNLAALSIILLSLNGCSTYEPQPLPGFKFTSQSPIVLGVNRVEVVSDLDSDLAPKEVRELYRGIAADLTTWAKNRFVAKHQAPGSVYVNLVELKVTELTSGDRLRHTNEEPWLALQAQAKVRLDHVDERGAPKGSIFAEASESLKMPDSMTLDHRNTEIVRLRQDLLNALDHEVTKSIQQSMAMLLSN
ncbi:MAG: hypothetical protein ACK5O7_04630 [Holosporales bacterium]